MRLDSAVKQKPIYLTQGEKGKSASLTNVGGTGSLVSSFARLWAFYDEVTEEDNGSPVYGVMEYLLRLSTMDDIFKRRLGLTLSEM